MHEIEQARALGAKRAAIHRMIRIALDVNDLGRSILGLVAEAVHQETAADRAVRTGVTCLRGACQLVLAYLGKHLGRRESQYPKARCAESSCTDCTELEELTSGYRYHHISPFHRPCGLLLGCQTVGYALPIWGIPFGAREC